MVKHKGQKNKPLSGKTQRREEQTNKWLNTKDRRTNYDLQNTTQQPK